MRLFDRQFFDVGAEAGGVDAESGGRVSVGGGLGQKDPGGEEDGRDGGQDAQERPGQAAEQSHRNSVSRGIGGVAGNQRQR